MSFENKEQINSRIAHLKGGLAESRARASRGFDSLKERITETPELVAVSRDAALQQMLARIRINTPGVIYGEATDVATPGLPEGAFGKRVLA